MKHKKLLLGLGIPLVVLIIVFTWFFDVPALLPHPRIVLALPYHLSDTPSGMIPMGETIFHPKPRVPHGHPGIDFNWDNGSHHEIIAAAAGTISKIQTVTKTTPTTYDIEVVSGAYAVRYKELSQAAPGLHAGQKLNIGDLIGYAGHNCDPQPENPHCWENIHWEFSSRSLLKDRYCPVTYFSTEARQAIETLWANQKPEDFRDIKKHFPDICSGDYEGKTE